MSKKIKQFNENFDNVVDDLHVDSDVPFGKANEEHDQNKKNYEGAIKENEKLAKETIPKEGETGKKVKSKALKAMHLSESLFDEELSFDSRDALTHELYRVITEVVKKYLWDGFSINELESILEEIVYHMKDDDEFQDYNIDDTFVESLKTSTKLNEDVESDYFKLFHTIAKEAQSRVDDLSNSRRLIYTLDEIIQEKLQETPSKAYLASLLYYYLPASKLVDIVVRDSNGEIINAFEDDLIEFLQSTGKMDDESIKYNIVEEKLQKFNEGLLPKEWNPDSYLNRLVEKNHLTESQVKQLKKRYL